MLWEEEEGRHVGKDGGVASNVLGMMGRRKEEKKERDHKALGLCVVWLRVANDIPPQLFLKKLARVGRACWACAHCSVIMDSQARG